MLPPTDMALLNATRSVLQLSAVAPSAGSLIWSTRSQLRFMSADAAHSSATPSAEGTTDPLSRRIVAEHNKIEGWFKEFERQGGANEQRRAQGPPG